MPRPPHPEDILAPPLAEPPAPVAQPAPAPPAGPEKQTPDQWAMKKHGQEIAQIVPGADGKPEVQKVTVLKGQKLHILAGAKVLKRWVDGDLLTEEQFDAGMQEHAETQWG